jgi:3-oxoacyl-ACP reductase-like protein
VASATTAADAAAPAAPSPAGGAAAAGPDLDDLARKLYDRLRGRLAAELRLDRERIGSLTDLRR